MHQHISFWPWCTSTMRQVVTHVSWVSRACDILDHVGGFSDVPWTPNITQPSSMSVSAKVLAVAPPGQVPRPKSQRSSNQVWPFFSVGSPFVHDFFPIVVPSASPTTGVDSMLAGSLESLWKSRIPQVEHGWSDAERWLEDGYRRCKKSWKLIQNHPHSSKYTKMNTESLIFKCVRPCWTKRNDDHNQVKKNAKTRLTNINTRGNGKKWDDWQAHLLGCKNCCRTSTKPIPIPIPIPYEHPTACITMMPRISTFSMDKIWTDMNKLNRCQIDVRLISSINIHHKYPLEAHALCGWTRWTHVSKPDFAMWLAMAAQQDRVATQMASPMKTHLTAQGAIRGPKSRRKTEEDQRC